MIGPTPKVLVFDVFGTVVDWRSSVIAEGQQLGKAKGLNIDWAVFADGMALDLPALHGQGAERRAAVD